MENRTIRQCKERWVNYLQPGLNNSPWTKAEDMILFEKVKQYGNSWAKIKKFFPRRTDINIKNRWSKISQIDFGQIPQKEEPKIEFGEENSTSIINTSFEDIPQPTLESFDFWPQLDEI